MALRAWGLLQRAWVVTVGPPVDGRAVLNRVGRDGRIDGWAPASVTFDGRDHPALAVGSPEAARSLARAVGTDHLWLVAGDSVDRRDGRPRANVWRWSIDRGQRHGVGEVYDAHISAVEFELAAVERSAT
jgi:hypothetical protein